MPDVTVTTGEFDLRREEQGLDFRANGSRSGLIGTLRVSKGGLRWWGPKERGDGHFVNWKQIAEFMSDKPRK